MPPSTAAQAWLERLPAAAREAAARHTDWRFVVFWLTGFAAIAVSLVVLRSDLLGRLRRRIERDRPRPWLATAALAGTFGLILFAALTLVDALAGWRDAALLGKPADLEGELMRALSSVAPQTGVLTLAASGGYWLMRRAPSSWPLIGGLIAVAALLAYGWAPGALIAPTGLRPLSPGPLRAELATLVADARIPVREISASPEPGLDIGVWGGFGPATIAVGPVLAGAPPEEASAMAGHLLGHFAHADVLRIWLVFGAIVALAIAAARMLFGPLSRALGASRLAGPADPEGLPVLVILAVITIGAGTIGLNAFIRYVNVGADQFALDHAKAPDGLAAVLDREWDHEAVDPPGWERWVFYAHPPLRDRLVRAMDWKAAHAR